MAWKTRSATSFTRCSRPASPGSSAASTTSAASSTILARSGNASGHQAGHVGLLGLEIGLPGGDHRHQLGHDRGSRHCVPDSWMSPVISDPAEPIPVRSGAHFSYNRRIGLLLSWEHPRSGPLQWSASGTRHAAWRDRIRVRRADSRLDPAGIRVGADRLEAASRARARSTGKRSSAARRRSFWTWAAATAGSRWPAPWPGPSSIISRSTSFPWSFATPPAAPTSGGCTM